MKVVPAAGLAGSYEAAEYQARSVEASPTANVPTSGLGRLFQKAWVRVGALSSLAYFLLFPLIVVSSSILCVVLQLIDLFILTQWWSRGYVSATRAGATFLIFALLCRMKYAAEGTIFQSNFAVWNLDAYTVGAAIKRTVLCAFHLERFLLLPLLAPIRRRVWDALDTLKPDAVGGVQLGVPYHQALLLVFERVHKAWRDISTIEDVVAWREERAAACADGDPTQWHGASARHSTTAARSDGAGSAPEEAAPLRGAARPGGFQDSAKTEQPITTQPAPSADAQQQRAEDSAGSPRASPYAAAAAAASRQPSSSIAGGGEDGFVPLTEEAFNDAGPHASATIVDFLSHEQFASQRRPAPSIDGIVFVVMDAQMDADEVQDDFHYLNAWSVFLNVFCFTLLQVYVFLHTGKISKLSVASIVLTVFTNSHSLQYGSLSSKVGYVSTNMGPAANPLMKLANLAYIFCHVASRLMLLVVLLLRSTGLNPFGGVAIFSALVNLAATDGLVFSIISNANGERDAIISMVFRKPYLKATVENALVYWSLKATYMLQFVFVNWWVAFLSAFGTGWKWRNRRIAGPLNALIRLVESAIIWGVLLNDAPVCRPDPKGWPQEPVGAPPPPPPLPPLTGAAAGEAEWANSTWLAERRCLLTWWVVAGCSAISLGSQFIVFWLYWPWLFRYFDSLCPEGDYGPGRGAAPGGIYDPATGEIRSFRPLSGSELVRYHRVRLLTMNRKEFMSTYRGFGEWMRSALVAWWRGEVEPGGAAAAAGAAGAARRTPGAARATAATTGVSFAALADPLPPPALPGLALASIGGRSALSWRTTGVYDSAAGGSSRSSGCACCAPKPWVLPPSNDSAKEETAPHLAGSLGGNEDPLLLSDWANAPADGEDVVVADVGGDVAP